MPIEFKKTTGDSLENLNESLKRSSSEVKKLNELIKGIKVAMLTTIDFDGSLYSRPMMTLETEFDGDLWFMTSKGSGKVRTMSSDQHVNVSYAAPSDNRYISVTGRVELVEDRQKIRELWNPLYRAWFPEGVEDPNIILLKVHSTAAEYWDAPNSKMVQLFGMAKALMTGKTYQPSPSENKKLDLH